MTRLILIATCLSIIAAPIATADEVLVSWEFNEAADAEGWVPFHSLSEFAVRGGQLLTTVTGPDPHMVTSAPEAFHIAANHFQYIEIRMRHDSGEGAEFFWTDTTEGPDAGFVAGKERGFSCIPDNEWHVYHVYPLWQGEITRLRLDPPGDGELAIDYIRIIQAPPSDHDPESPQWQFAAPDTGGWVGVRGCTHLRSADGAVTTTLTADSAHLVSPALSISAGDYRYAFVRIHSSADVAATLSWSATDDGNFPGCNVVQIGQFQGSYLNNIDLTECPMYDGPIRRLSLQVKADPGTRIELRDFALTDRPMGPARLQLLSFRAHKALAPIGEPVRLTARVRNMGGRPIRDAVVRLQPPDSGLQLQNAPEKPLADLAPGAEQEAQWTVVPRSPGAFTIQLHGPDDLRASTRIGAAREFPPPSPAAGPTARVISEAAWIRNAHIALTFVKGQHGFAYGRLDALAPETTRPMAVLPHLASVAIDGGDFIELSALDAEAQQLEPTTAMLTFRARKQTDAADIRCSVRFILRADVPHVRAQYRLSADSDVNISAFRGPWLWVGEGDFGTNQDMALYPGVEYMVSGERSSSTLDIAPPKHIRFAPHPNTVTIPSMAIEKDGVTAGLMWDPLQKWDGEHQKPTSIFASPNFVEGHDNHLLGLYLPAIGEWMEPNQLRAATPYPLEAGAQLQLNASLYAVPGGVLRAVDLYFDRYGIPELPPTPRSLTETVEMCMKAYEGALWSETGEGWVPIVGRNLAPTLTFAPYYLIGARHIDDNQFAAHLKQKGASLAQSPTHNLLPALHHFGRPTNALADALASARAKARSTPEDGKYTFQPTGRRRNLGSEGATAVGICARQLRPMLQDALRTGDTSGLNEALKTLKFMERFKVPRASQVWEVPVHTPDVLASADACDVYLMAYKLTRDKGYLDRAVYWARTGLPFIYMWQAPDQRPLMKGGSIPVFGASFYVGSWFARPVQWNGLAYAQVLTELARYDESLPWRHFASMITISGMNQQSTRPEDYGAYTDNWDVIDDIECKVCMLHPTPILRNALTLAGRPAVIRTQTVHDDAGPICITSAPIVNEAQLDDDLLQLSLTYDPGYAGYTTVMPVTQPASIDVDGKSLPKQPSPIAAENGWAYQNDLGCVTLKLTYGDGPKTVRIRGVERTAPHILPPNWTFDRPGDTEGWSPLHSVQPLEAEDGKLIVQTSGDDPYIASPFLFIPADNCTAIELRAKVTRPGTRLFFATDGGFVAERSQGFDLPADGQFHKVTIDLSDNEFWQGVISQLRLDFANPPCRAEIDWIRLVCGEHAQ